MASRVLVGVLALAGSMWVAQSAFAAPERATLRRSKVSRPKPLPTGSLTNQAGKATAKTSSVFIPGRVYTRSINQAGKATAKTSSVFVPGRVYTRSIKQAGKATAKTSSVFVPGRVYTRSKK